MRCRVCECASVASALEVRGWHVDALGCTHSIQLLGTFEVNWCFNGRLLIDIHELIPSKVCRLVSKLILAGWFVCRAHHLDELINCFIGCQCVSPE